VPPGREFAAGFAARGGTPVRVVDIVLPNQLVVIVEMRIFVDILVVLGVVFDRMLGLVGHGHLVESVWSLACACGKLRANESPFHYI